MASLFYTVLATLAVFSPGLCKEKPYLQRAGTAFNSRPYSSVITVTNGERYGKWHWREMCPDQFFAVGFSIRVEPKQYRRDDTALNGIRLFCAKDGDIDYLYSVESHTGYWGDWFYPQYCPSGMLTSFQLRVEPTLGLAGDDTAANNIKFRCSSKPILEGPGMDWGDYGQWSQECVQGGICGIETKIEEYQHSKDDTSLNDVRFYCCARIPQ